MCCLRQQHPGATCLVLLDTWIIMSIIQNIVYIFAICYKATACTIVIVVVGAMELIIHWTGFVHHHFIYAAWDLLDDFFSSLNDFSVSHQRSSIVFICAV